MNHIFSYLIIISLTLVMTGGSISALRYSLKSENNISYLNKALKSQQSIASSGKESGLVNKEVLAVNDECLALMSTKETSVVDFLKAEGKKALFNDRVVLAKEYEIENYKGTAGQNLELIRKVKSEKYGCGGNNVK